MVIHRCSMGRNGTKIKKPNFGAIWLSWGLLTLSTCIFLTKRVWHTVVGFELVLGMYILRSQHQNGYTFIHTVTMKGGCFLVQTLASKVTLVRIEHVCIVQSTRTMIVVVETKNIHPKDQFKSHNYVLNSLGLLDTRSTRLGSGKVPKLS